MANTTSAKKALRSSERKRVINNSRKSRIRTFIKKVTDAIKAGDKKTALVAFKALEPEMMRGVTKRVFKLNSASRKISRLNSQIKKIEETKKS